MDQIVQSSPIIPTRIGAFCSNQITNHCRILAGIRQTVTQLTIVNLQARSKKLHLRLNGLETSVQFGQCRRNGRRQTKVLSHLFYAPMPRPTSATDLAGCVSGKQTTQLHPWLTPGRNPKSWRALLEPSSFLPFPR